MISDILKETHAMLAMRRVFEGAAVVTFFLICVFTARSIWIVGVFKTYDSVVGHDAWKGMFVDPLDPDKSDCRALFARPASDDDFYPTSYIEHRGNFERELRVEYTVRASSWDTLADLMPSLVSTTGWRVDRG